MRSGVDDVKAGKDKAMRQYLGSRETNKMVMRLLEACLALILIVCCSSTRLQTALRFSAGHLCRLMAVLNNRRFVFLIENAIVLAIVLESRCSSSSPESEGRNNLHYLSGADDAESCEEVEENLHGDSAAAASESPEVLLQQQQQTFVSTGWPHVPVAAAEESTTSTAEAEEEMNTQMVAFVGDSVAAASATSPVATSELPSLWRRSQSQSMECGFDVDVDDWDAVEELSSEEFRLTVEAFINKNRSLMRQESATAMTVL